MTTTTTPFKTASIGWERDDGDFALVATLNNNDEYVSDEQFAHMINIVSTLWQLAQPDEKIMALNREDAPDYISLNTPIADASIFPLKPQGIKSREEIAKYVLAQMTGGYDTKRYPTALSVLEGMETYAAKHGDDKTGFWGTSSDPDDEEVGIDDYEPFSMHSIGDFLYQVREQCDSLSRFINNIGFNEL